MKEDVLQPNTFADDGDEYVDTQYDPAIGPHGILDDSEEGLDSQMLIGSFEKQLPCQR